VSIGNESVPIQLAQCRFPGQAIFNAKNINIFFQIKYTEEQFLPRDAILARYCRDAEFFCAVVILSICAAVAPIENESVPIQLAQCWFPGLAIFNAKF